MDPPGEVLEDEYMLANTSNHARPTKNIHVVSTLNKEQRYNTRFDPWCSRCCMECGSSYPGWFSIQEGDQTLDIPASFGPTSWQARGTKFVMMVWFNGTLVYHWWVSYADRAAFFLSYLTHWGLIFASLWLIVTFCNSLYPPAQPNGRLDEPISLWTKFSWLLFTVAAHFTLIVVVLYWILDYKPGVSVLDYMNIFTHGGVILIWPEGLLVDRIPVRWKHLPLPMFLATCYCVWLVIHQLYTDIGVPVKFDDNPETNDDLLYTAIDFERNTTFSAVLCTVVVLVVTPLQHALLWSLSLYSCCPSCSCSGRNRRYVAVRRSSDEETTAVLESAIFDDEEGGL